MWRYLKWLVILGNILFIAWITINGIDEGFAGTEIQKISYVSLVILLLLNILIICKRKRS